MTGHSRMTSQYHGNRPEHQGKEVGGRGGPATVKHLAKTALYGCKFTTPIGKV